MASEIRVWVRKRKGKKGTTFHLRWIEPGSGRWRNRKVGSDSRLAEREATRLEDELLRGTYVDLKRVDWGTFIDEVTALIEGNHRMRARRVLT